MDGRIRGLQRQGLVGVGPVEDEDAAPTRIDVGRTEGARQQQHAFLAQAIDGGAVARARGAIWTGRGGRVERWYIDSGMKPFTPAVAAVLLGAATWLGVSEAAPAADADAPDPAPQPVVVFETTMGTMSFRLLADRAPATVAHFRELVESGFYDGKPFYRIVAGHVIQAGDGGGNGHPTVVGEFGAHDHVEGALGLARDADPDSGTTEIYICLAPRPHLDGAYAVFGLIEDGIEVLRAIGGVPVEERWLGEVAFHTPVEPVLIRRATLRPPE